MTRSVFSWLLALGVSALGACAPGGMSNDGGTDASADANADAGPTYRTCDPANIRDITPMRQGMRTEVTGNNNVSDAQQQLNPPMGCTQGRAVRQVAFKYTAASTAFLRASTTLTASMQDTVVWIVTECDRVNMPLGCNDDSPTGGTAGSSVTTSRKVMAGETIYIIVADYQMGTTVPRGAQFTLTVEELPEVALGMSCDPASTPDLCVETATCLATAVQLGTCTANGSAPRTRCRPDNGQPRCDNGLQCFTDDSGSFCYRPATTGGACNYINDRCPSGNVCLSIDPSDVANGRCFAAGTRGGTCTTTAPCDSTMMLTCSTTDPQATGICQAAGMTDGACVPTPLGSVKCPMSNTCTYNDARNGYACRVDGTAAGTPCRDGAMRCDGMLQCSAAAGAGVCQNVVASGMCTPHLRVDRCATGTVCAASSFTTGTCTMPTEEGATDAPNSPTAALAAPARTLPFVFHGTITMANNANDADCFAFALTQGQSIYAETNDGAGGCPDQDAMMNKADTYLTVWNAQGKLLDLSDDSGITFCSLLDGTPNGEILHNLPAGNYVACVQSYPRAPMAIPSYYLNISAR